MHALLQGADGGAAAGVGPAGGGGNGGGRKGGVGMLATAAMAAHLQEVARATSTLRGVQARNRARVHDSLGRAKEWNIWEAVGSKQRSDVRGGQRPVGEATIKL